MERSVDLVAGRMDRGNGFADTRVTLELRVCICNGTDRLSVGEPRVDSSVVVVVCFCCGCWTIAITIVLFVRCCARLLLGALWLPCTLHEPIRTIHMAKPAMADGGLTDCLYTQRTASDHDRIGLEQH